MCFLQLIRRNSQPAFPLPIMARGVKDGIDYYSVFNDSKDDSVGEAVWVGPPHLFAAMTHAEEERITGETNHCVSR